MVLYISYIQFFVGIPYAQCPVGVIVQMSYISKRQIICVALSTSFPFQTSSTSPRQSISCLGRICRFSLCLKKAHKFPHSSPLHPSLHFLSRLAPLRPVGDKLLHTAEVVVDGIRRRVRGFGTVHAVAELVLDGQAAGGVVAG